jgi:cytochrome c
LPRTKLEWLASQKEDKEMKAMIAYIEYIGKDVPKEEAKLWDL